MLGLFLPPFPGSISGEPAAKYDFDPSTLGTSSSSNLLPPPPLLLPLAGERALPYSLPLPSNPPLSLTGDIPPGVGASSTYRLVRVIFLSLSLSLRPDDVPDKVDDADDGETSFTFSTTGDGDGDGVPRSVPSVLLPPPPSLPSPTPPPPEQVPFSVPSPSNPPPPATGVGVTHGSVNGLAARPTTTHNNPANTVPVAHANMSALRRAAPPLAGSRWW